MYVGVIGLNGFAAKLIEGLKNNTHLRLRYGYHPDVRKAKEWNAELGTADLNDILGSKDIQAIFVLSPTYSHADYCLKAASAGKSVFVEKPLALSLNEARDIVKEFNRKKLTLMVGHNFRRQSWFREVKALLESGKIGKVLNITMNRSHGAIFDLPQDSWRKDAARHPEGPLSTVGIHYFDLLHYWFGPIRFAEAILSNAAGKSRAPDTNAVFLILENEATVFLQTNYSQCSENYVHIFGTEGTIYCEGNRLFLRLGRDRNRVASEKKEIPLSEDRSIPEEIEEFYQTIAKGTPAETGAREGLNNMIVLDACRVSHERQKRVFLNEYPDYSVRDLAMMGA